MKVTDKIVLVTGGAHGIGKALCERFAAEGASKVIVTDLDFEAAQKVAESIGGAAFRLDVADEAAVQTVVQTILQDYGRIDLICSNAGIGGEEGCLEVSNAVWQQIYEVNVLSHLYLARAAFPSMLERGSGYFLLTVSAAGLLSHFDAAPYTVSKHAALALGEYLSIAYHDAGIRVSCLCPQGVKTAMLSTAADAPEHFLMDGAITAEECADAVVKGLESENFLILPHPQVADFVVKKAENRDRWLGSLRKMKQANQARKTAQNNL
jgi:NAD(P)-dependent dehydrogenase (short-subunit alcohol dehydrogenase family)